MLINPQAGVQTITPEMFGCIGDGVTDDTVALQAAITWCKANGKNLYLSSKSYLVTSSLNCTFNTTTAPGFKIIGQGKQKSIILHTFSGTELYPVIDMCGNTFGGIENLAIIPSGTSHATAAYLSAKGAIGGGTGNGQIVRSCSLQAGILSGDCCAVFYNTDLSRIVDSDLHSTAAGLSMGLAKPANVTSKFITMSNAADWTQGYITRCEIVGSLDPALRWMGGGSINILDTYCAITGTGNSKIIEVTSPSGSSGNQIIANSLRTENQSSATGVTALYCTAALLYADIDAVLESDASGYMIGSGAAGIALCKLRLIGSTAAFFNIGDGGIQDCDIYANAGAPGFGTVTTAGKAASWGLKFAGNLAVASINTNFGTTAGLEIRQAGLYYENKFKNGYAPTLTTQTGRERIVLKELVGNTTAYTGGSGANNLMSDTLYLGALSLWSTQLPSPHMDYEVSFNVNAFGAAGTFAVQIVQGANTSTVASITPPTTNGYMNCRLKLITTSNPTVLRAECTILFNGTTPFVLSRNIQSDGISPASGNATFQIVATSTNNIAAAEYHTTQIV